MDGADVDGRLWLIIGLRDGLLLDRLRTEGIDGLGAGWLLLGAELRLRGAGIIRCGADRLEGIVRCGLGREIDRDGDRLGILERDDIGLRLVRDEDRIEDIERLGLELRVLREGMVRCGVGRETDREGDRLGVGVDLVVDRLAWLLLRELRRDDPASAAKARSRTAVTIAARIATLELEVFFTRYILDLLSPAVVLPGNPGLALPHHRRHSKRHVRSCDL